MLWTTLDKQTNKQAKPKLRRDLFINIRN